MDECRPTKEEPIPIFQWCTRLVSVARDRGTESLLVKIDCRSQRKETAVQGVTLVTSTAAVLLRKRS